MNDTLIKLGYPLTLVKEYKHWCLLFRPKQITLGSLVLVCKEDTIEFSRISSASFEEYTKILPIIEEKLKFLFNYDKINHLMLMMNDPHVHFHIIPRYANSKNFNGYIFQDLGWPTIPDFSQDNQIPSNIFNQVLQFISVSFNDCKIPSIKKYNRVYTTGVFDLFHPGHLNIIKQSKEIAHYLIVGISTDELVWHCKNKRPIIPFEERKKNNFFYYLC